MYVKYFVISKYRDDDSLWVDYVSIPYHTVDQAREHANVLAKDYRDRRYYIAEAFEWAEQIDNTVDFVQLKEY